jgi:hypothetical protein
MTHRLLARVGLALACLAAPLAAPSTATAAPGAVIAVAVTGTDNGLWVKYTNQPSWFNLGGHLADAPAVVRQGSTDYFLAQGGDGNVWVRTLKQGWRPMAPANTRCAGIAAAASPTEIAVACRGTDGALWVGKAPTPSGGLPYVGGFRSLGGGLRHGVGVAYNSNPHDQIPRGFLYSGVGNDDRAYVRNDRVGWKALGYRDDWCSGTFSLANQGQDGACARRQDGQLLHFYVDHGFAVEEGGQVRGRIGVTMDSDEDTRFFALGADGRIWMLRQGSWTFFGGAGKHGVAAITYAA